MGFFFLSPAINVTKADGSLVMFSLHCTLDRTAHMYTFTPITTRRIRRAVQGDNCYEECRFFN